MKQAAFAVTAVFVSLLASSCRNADSSVELRESKGDTTQCVSSSVASGESGAAADELEISRRADHGEAGGKSADATDERPLFDPHFDGVYVDKQDDGSEYVVGYTKESARVGRWIWLWKDSKKPQILENYSNGVLHGIRQIWDKSGTLVEEGRYNEGNKQGLWRTWHDSGQLKSEEFFSDGKLDGCVVRWYDNGHRESEYSFVDGVEVGCERHWHENGSIMGQCYYKNGLLDGSFSVWAENGTRIVQGIYKLGRKDSVWREWDSNGVLRNSTTYKDGTPEG